jgi:tetratricopeptide (TPR) repeat protein
MEIRGLGRFEGGNPPGAYAGDALLVTGTGSAPLKAQELAAPQGREMKTIPELRDRLVKAQRMSGQSSYERRAPSAQSVPAFLAVEADLHGFLQQHPDNAEAWRLLSLAQECLLNYQGAVASLERATRLSAKRDPRDLKRLALLREQQAKWSALSLTADDLANLGQYLETALSQSPCDHSLAQTREWLASRPGAETDRILQALRHHGGYCDCEVLLNVV